MPQRTVIDANFSNYVVYKWELAQAATGDQQVASPTGDRSVQVFGTFGGASVRWEGSLDGVNYSALTDPQGNELSMSANKLEAVLELAPFIRPVVSGGDVSTSLTCLLCVKGI